MSMRVAILGLGDIAQKAYLPLLSTWEGIELFLHSRRPEHVAALQAQYRIPDGSADVARLMDWGPAAAFVLTPSLSHRRVAEPLLEAGIDVFIEKPLSLTLEDSLHLAQLAERLGRILMVGFNRRYAPLHRQARELWGERRVQMAVLQKNRASAFHPGLYKNYIDDTIHIIDLLRFFCGDGTAVHTSFQMENGKLTGAASTVAYDHGGFGLVLTSLQAGAWDEQYALHGESTSIYVDAFNRLTLVAKNEKKVWEETYASSWRMNQKARGFVDEIAHFFDCVQSRSQPQTSAWEAYRTQQLVEAMVAAAGGAAGG